MQVLQTQIGDDYWQRTIEFADTCSWVAGKHLARLMRSNYFHDWETVFIAVKDDEVIGFCTFMKEDYYPENRYSPWISCLFVDEKYRGERISHQMIETAIHHAKVYNFLKVFIPSDMIGFYEKCGFEQIDTLKNYGGDIDRIFMRQI